MKYPKILVGAPVTDLMEYCFDRFIESMKNLSYPNYDIFLVDNSKDAKFFEKIKSMKVPCERIDYIEGDPRLRLVECRNIIRKKVLKEGYDYLYCADQDVIPPRDILERLLEHKKDVISGMYFNKGKEGEPYPVVKMPDETFEKDGRVRLPTQEEINTLGLVRVALTGTGCLLIHRPVLQRIKFRNELHLPVWDDTNFAVDCKKLGITMYADLSIMCEHLIDDKPWKWKIKAEMSDKGLSVKWMEILPKSQLTGNEKYYY